MKLALSLLTTLALAGTQIVLPSPVYAGSLFGIARGALAKRAWTPVRVFLRGDAAMAAKRGQQVGNLAYPGVEDPVVQPLIVEHHCGRVRPVAGVMRQ